MKTKTTLLSIALIAALGLGAGSAQAVSTTGNNLTMLDPAGNTLGGTNDVAMTWDQQLNTSTSDPVTPATEHMTLSSGYPFFGYNWTAHHIRVFGPGTYNINVDCASAQLEAGTCAANANPARNYTFTVGVNQIGAHMLFDWNTIVNADIVDIWNQNAVFGPSPMYIGTNGFNPSSTVWGLMSTDWDGDGINGGKFIDGQLTGFSANFNLNAVPIPATFWLFSSGLIGLFGIMRKRKTH
jgi:hypothetical protein